MLIKDDLKSKGNIVQIVRNEAHTEMKSHYHKQMTEIYHILKGNAVVFCGDLRVRAQPGDTLLCEPGEVHGVVNDNGRRIRVCSFQNQRKRRRHVLGIYSIS